MAIASASRGSIVTDGAMQGQPLWVTLSKIVMRQGRALFDISEIRFGFDKREGLYRHL